MSYGPDRTEPDWTEPDRTAPDRAGGRPQTETAGPSRPHRAGGPGSSRRDAGRHTSGPKPAVG